MASNLRISVVKSKEELLAEVKGAHNRVYVLFTGSKLPDGTSWCPDCNLAEPVVHKVVSQVADVHLIECHVGLRDEWKNPACIYRHEFNLTAVPTLVNWKSPSKRLVEAQCADANLVEMLFEE